MRKTNRGGRKISRGVGCPYDKRKSSGKQKGKAKNMEDSGKLRKSELVKMSKKGGNKVEVGKRLETRRGQKETD